MVDTRGSQVRAVTWACLTLSSVATLLRIYCRGWVTKAFSADDWLAVIAQGLFVVFCAYEITGVYWGTGQHFKDIPPERIPRAMQMWWTCEPTYVLTNMAIKASIAIFLLRIFTERLHKIIVWSVLILTQIYSFFFFLLFVLQCRPTSLFWERYGANPPDGHCLDATVISKTFYGYAAISCLTDWTYSLLPIVLVSRLQMSSRVKISVCMILAAGAIASSATIVRFPYLWSLTDIDDFLYSTSDVAIWSTVETGIGITTAALATLRPLMRTFFGGGSSAPGHGTSARQWHRTGSGHHGSSKGDEAFSMGHRSGRHNHHGGASASATRSSNLGVTTIIDYGKDEDDDEMALDLENQQQNHHRKGSAASETSGDDDAWDRHSHQSSVGSYGRSGPIQRGSGGGNTATVANPWQITVKQSIVQTRGLE